MVMNRRLTAEERRIIERTRREGEPSSTPIDGSETPNPGDRMPLWRSVLSWIGAIFLLVAIAWLMIYIGSLITS